jgi:DNA helicase HerA-like ATPase
MADLEGILIARGTTDCVLLPHMANRHGLIAGATGTGKTVTLQVLAEAFSSIGVPVFAADVKGDLSGVSQAGGGNPKVDERVAQLGLAPYPMWASPVEFWDLVGDQGHPVRAAVSELGPLLLARILNLNDTQEGVLNIAFRAADDAGLLLLDLKDLRALLAYVGQNAAQYTTTYGNVSPASIGAIQRGLLTLEEQGGDRFFGEPALDLFDFLQTDANGKGVINILAADRLMTSPRAYSTMLLWLLSELFERLPEVGDLPKPKLVFFFDEAHLLFTDAPPALLQSIEQVVRLIRSKGVGIYFITQNPIDIPDTVLGQLGNKVQHAIRAFTPREQKAVAAMAETFRQNPAVDVETAVTQLNVGEALISVLDATGSPTPVERAFVVPPHGHIGAITPEQRAAVLANSVLAGVYETAVDRESAFEQLKARAEATIAAQAQAAAQTAAAKAEADAQAAAAKATAAAEKQAAADARVAARPAGRQTESLVEAMANSAMHAMGSQVGRSLIRGVLGTLTGGSRR